jgi:Ca-activated chloride channel family protein
MFHFENTTYFYLLLLVPVAIGLFVGALWQTRQLRAHFGDLLGLERLAPDISTYKRPFKFGLLLLAFVFLVLAMANPRMGNTTQSVEREGIDVYIALDISRSMWARDVKPDRMERARQFAQKLVNELRGDRVGLIVFAGYPYLQMPLTTDYAAATSFIQIASPKLDVSQGTAIELAINQVLDISAKENQEKQRAIIIITDGENHETQAPQAAQTAKEQGVTTFVVGIGTEAGAPIPLQDSRYAQFQRDEQNNIVQSKMNTPLLQQIAQKGGGKFYKANQKSDLVIARLVKELSKLERSSFEQQEFDVYETYYQYFVAVALLLLILEFTISYRKSKWLP